MIETLRRGMKKYPLLWGMGMGLFTIFAAFSAGRATEMPDMIVDAFSAFGGLVYTMHFGYQGGIKSITSEKP